MVTSPTTSSASSSARDALRELLRSWQPPAGADGFEGLVAQALATVTGLTFRLARSGSQFGRDAATPNSTFSIAMEAKRYSDSVPLQELAGKAALASFMLADGIDVWALAATVEVSEPTERTLRQILEEGGITLLTLDWTDTGLPPLAVLLAAARDDVIAWSASRIDAAASATLVAGLDAIRADAGYDAALKDLMERTSSPTMGLASLKRMSGEWCERHFASRRLAQRQFSQFLAPLEPSAPAIPRTAILSSLDAAVAAARDDEEGDTLVAVLGGEGSGKSWAVATWWLLRDPRPVLLLSVGRMADHLSGDAEPIEMLARLAAHQDGGRDQRTVARWRRRLERWSRADPARDRFVVVVDGLNETSGRHWSTILSALLPAAHALGGVVVATCREEYWRREVEQRLSLVSVRRVRVPDYDDAEFREVLSRGGFDPATLPPRLDRFMRNPRICALALTLLPRLSGEEDLSIDRLLLEYWRARMLERGDLVGHDETDFRDLLVRHARDYRARPGTDFDRNEWRSRSGAARRGDGRDLVNDLTDIEEGRFFDSERGAYRFRDDTLHFALGLLVADETREAARTRPDALDETLAGILDPIRGFDAVAEILTAAIATACLDDRFPEIGIAALVTAWMALQNLPEDAADQLVPYVAARPEPFLDAFEGRDLDRDDGRFLRLLLHASDTRPSVATAMGARVNRWFGTWTRALPERGDASDRERQERHDAEVEARIAGLTEEERRFFDGNCRELRTGAGLAGAAAVYVFGRPQAEFARGIVAFAMAYKVASNYRAPWEDVAWAIRLNRVDHIELSRAVRAEIEVLNAPGGSQVARSASAASLRLLGSLDAEIEADALSPPRRHFLDGDRDRDVDPLDPAASPPANVGNLVERLATLESRSFWNHMSPTGEDHDLERSTDMLVRFEFDGVRAVLQAIASTISERRGLPLRQLGWRLPWLSPLLCRQTVEAIRARIQEVCANPALAPSDDQNFVVGMMVESVLPSLEASSQLDLLQSLPPAAPFYLRYGVLAKQLSGTEAAQRLAAAEDAHPRVLERTLFFLSSTDTKVTDDMRASVIRCLRGSESDVVAAAAQFARTRADDALDDAVLELQLPTESDTSGQGSTLRAAFSSAVARRSRVDLVDQIPVEHLDWVAARLPAAKDRLTDAIETAVEQLARPIPSTEPADAVVLLEVEDNDIGRFSLEDRGGHGRSPLEAIEALNAEMADTDGARFARRRRLLGDQLDRFLASLASAGALVMARRPYDAGLGEIARERPERYAGWLRTILSTSDRRALRQVQNLGLALARSYAEIDPGLAARTFLHLWPVEPHVTVTIGTAKHPIRHLALFGAGSSAEIDALRAKVIEEAADDGGIERIVLAAEAAGAGGWLDRFVRSRSASPLPADLALAITVCSWRTTNALSDEVLGRDWGDDFLGGVADAGRSRYRRASWSDHWFGEAERATDAFERWRLIELAVSAADRRQLLQPVYRRDASVRLIGADLPQRLRKAADRVTKEAGRTLFGIRPPGGLIGERLG